MKIEMSSFQPYLISNFPGYKLVERSLSHEFPSRFMCGKGFLSSFIKGGESIFKSWKEGFTEGGVGASFISIKNGEFLVELCGAELWWNSADDKDCAHD